jgi:hypothetical protein
LSTSTAAAATAVTVAAEIGTYCVVVKSDKSAVLASG